MKTSFIAAALLLTLSGCSSQEYKDNVTTNNSVKAEIATRSTVKHNAKVGYITLPPVTQHTMTEKVNTAWLDAPVTVNASDMPLSIVIEEIMNGVAIPIWFSEDVEPNKLVSLNFSSSRLDVLNLLSRESGYGIATNDKRLEITKFVTESFSLNIPAGKYSAQLGSQGEESDSDSARIEGQYLNVEYDEIQIVDEIADGIVKLLGGDEVAKNAVSSSTALSSITVRATPDQMREVRTLIDHAQRDLSKQVILDIRVLEFKSNLGTERGIDWNVVRDTGDGLLQFFVPGTTTVSNGAGYGLAFSGTGKWSGSESLIKVLKKQGSVSTETLITALALNNQPAKITQQRVEPHISEASSESSEGVVSASVKRDKEVEGVDMMVIANVQQNFVWLRISGQLQKIVNREDRAVQDIALQLLTTQKSEITFTNKLCYGQTYVIASIKQTSHLAEKSESFWTTFFGGTGSSTDTVETLVLLTPRKVE
ncbi:hypothetical protein L4C31_01395 [Aliivibrio sifiae]